MDSNADSYFEESSEAEEEVAGPLQIIMEESPESPPPESPSPVPTRRIPEEELTLGWELPDDGTNFKNFSTRADVLELRHQ